MKPNLGVLLLGLSIFAIVLIVSRGWNREGCKFSRQVVAWVDANGNGVKEDDEPLLSGVRFVAGSPSGVGEEVGPDRTDGEEVISFLYVCGQRQWDVVAYAPPGYRHTTPERVKTDQAYDAPAFLFGFIREVR